MNTTRLASCKRSSSLLLTWSPKQFLKSSTQQQRLYKSNWLHYFHPGHITSKYNNEAKLMSTESSNMVKRESDLAHLVEKKDLEPKEAKWVKLQKIAYKNPDGDLRDWEMAARTTRVEGQEIDGVGIIALIKSPGKKIPQVVVQKQFRPPVGGVCIEFPAGLLDPNETPLQCALRELHEETGYIAHEKDHVSTSKVLYNDAGFTNTNLVTVTVTVDMSLPENLNPVPQLEENEYIETFLVDLDKLPGEIENWSAKGYKIDSKVGSLVTGMLLSGQYLH